MAKGVSVLRALRSRQRLSQTQYAATLGVPVETLRAWDAGRRTPPPEVVLKARTLAANNPEREQVPLRVLANELGVHVRTLRAAARDGRLAATFGNRSYFGKLVATATRQAGTDFMKKWYRRTYGRGQRVPASVCRVDVPSNWAPILIGLRVRLGLSQQQLARRVGAAGKAVIYQWESGKRRPSQVFWLRVQRLQGSHRP